MISVGRIGITRRCSIVPVLSLAQQGGTRSITDKMLILLTSAITDMNHWEFNFGLNLAWTTRSTERGDAGFSSCCEALRLLCDVLRQGPAPLPAWVSAVASMSICKEGRRPEGRPARTAAGSSMTKTRSPEFSALSI